MLIRDKATHSTRKKLANGFLRVDAVLARTGIQLYSAGELGLTDRAAHETVRVWRPAAEVFKPESMASFSMVPLTDNHPPDGVDAKNARDLTVGWTGDAPRRDGDTLTSTIIISTEDAIAKLDGGKVELSNGYDCEFDMTPGIVPQGERDAGQAYDCRMFNIEGNHVALVDAGRCGSECRVLDGAPPKPVTDCASDCQCSKGDATMADKALEKKIIDGVGLVESTAEGFAVIDSLTRKANDLQAKLDEATGAAAAAQTAHETALAAKDTEIADLKSKAPAGAALDALVNARAQLVSDAKRIGGAELVTDGKTDLEIQKDAVTAHMGDAEKVKGWNDSQFTGAFSYLATQVSDDGGDAGAREERQEPSGLRDALRPQPQATNDGKADSYESKMSARWSSKKKAAA